MSPSLTEGDVHVSVVFFFFCLNSKGFEDIINLALYVRSSFTDFCLFLMFNALIQSVSSTRKTHLHVVSF